MKPRKNRIRMLGSRGRAFNATSIAAALAIGAAAMEGCGDSSRSDPASSKSRLKILSQPTPTATSQHSVPSADPAMWETPQADLELEAGRLVWTGTCIQCHSTGLGGAPLIGNESHWRPRVDKGIETLVAHATNGFYGDVGEMPARGGNAELTDTDVEAAVRFMASRIGDLD